MPTILLIRPENRLAPDIAACAAAGWQAIPFSPIRIAPIPDTLFRLPQTIAPAQALFWVSPTAVEIAAPHIGSLKTCGMQQNRLNFKNNAFTMPLPFLTTFNEKIR